MTGKLCVCSAVTGNYLAFARVLAASFNRHHPGIPFYLLLADGPVPELPAKLVTLEDLAIPELNRMLLRYSRKQVIVAAKPALLRHLLDAGYDTVVFLDPDTLVTASLDPLFEAASNHSFTVTPHLCPGSATAASERPSLEHNLLLAGIYNGGVIGISNRAESRQFLAWWERRLHTHCLEALSQGIHYDQRWLDLAPAFIADFHILRDPGINAAYWNLPDHELTEQPTGLHLDGAPIRLFHFSGFSPAHPEHATSWRYNLLLEDLGPAAGLYRQYNELLLNAGWARDIKKPWPWDGWRKLFRRVFPPKI